MISNYLAVAWRNMLRNKLASAINIIGLSAGIATCLLAYVFIVYETGFDRHHPEAERIFRLESEYRLKDGTSENTTAKMAPAEGGLLRQAMPELEGLVRLYATPDKGVQIEQGEQRYLEQHVYFADPEVFELFAFDFIEGTPADALDSPFKVVLTRSVARKLFGDRPAKGNTVSYGGSKDLEISGVIADVPRQSHLAVSMLVSISTVPQMFAQDALDVWTGARCYTYLKLPVGLDADAATARVTELLRRHKPPDRYESNYRLTPLTDIHLHGQHQNEMRPNGDIKNIYTLLITCVLMLLVVGINFVNLATARAMQRAKEVGVRKSIGAHRGQLIAQFMGEAGFMTAVAGVIGLAVAAALLPTVSGLFDRAMTPALLFAPDTLLFWLASLVLVSVLAGLYPAVVLSGFEPARVLKGEISGGERGKFFRTSLVGFQFAITVFLIICTISMSLQMRYVTEDRIGYDKDRKLMLKVPYSQTRAFEALQNDLRRHPDVLAVAGSSAIPTETVGDKRNFYRTGRDGEPVHLPFVAAEEEFVEFYELALLHGRALSPRYSTDKLLAGAKDEGTVPMAFLVNEMAAKEFGWSPQDSVGKRLEIGIGNSRRAGGEIVGVLRDTNFDSFKSQPQPLVFYADDTDYSRISLQLSGDRMAEVLDHVEAVWRRHLPEEPMDLRHVDAMFEALYRNEHQQLLFFNSLATLSILLSMLGLYGLTAFSTQRRAREIAVRKVLGASDLNIVALLGRQVILLVAAASVVAWPLAHWLVNSWLQTFSYRIDLTFWIFAGAAFAALALAWVAFASQALLIVRQPVTQALKYE
jgi:putative ABC transport system permease protein